MLEFVLVTWDCDVRNVISLALYLQTCWVGLGWCLFKECCSSLSSRVMHCDYCQYLNSGLFSPLSPSVSVGRVWRNILNIKKLLVENWRKRADHMGFGSFTWWMWFHWEWLDMGINTLRLDLSSTNERDIWTNSFWPDVDTMSHLGY